MRGRCGSLVAVIGLISARVVLVMRAAMVAMLGRGRKRETRQMDVWNAVVFFRAVMT